MKVMRMLDSKLKHNMLFHDKIPEWLAAALRKISSSSWVQNYQKGPVIVTIKLDTLKLQYEIQLRDIPYFKILGKVSLNYSDLVKD